jgi:hypothetical protein
MVLRYSVRETDAYGPSTNSGQNRLSIRDCTSGDAVTGAQAWTEAQRGVPAFDCGRSSQSGVVDRRREA